VNDRGLLQIGDLDIRTLRYFVAVADELSFTRAAERLFVAQQAISRDIRRLESQLGTTLFDRTTRRVTLTPDGERLLAEARELLAVHDRILARRAPTTKPVSVDLMSEGRLTGPRFLQALRTAAPDREFRSRYGGAMGASMRRLEAGDLDVALGRAEWRGQRRSKAIRTRRIRYEPLAFILPSFPCIRRARRRAGRSARRAPRSTRTRPRRTPRNGLDIGEQFLAFAGATATAPHEAALGQDDQADHLVRQGLPILTSSTTWASPAASSGRSSTRCRSTRGPSPGGRRRTATWSPRSRRPSRRSRPTPTGWRSRTAPGYPSRRRRRGDAYAAAGRGSDLCQEVLAPLLRLLDRVERVQVDLDDLRGGVGGVRRDPLEQAVRPVEAAAPHQPGDEPDVLRQEPMRVGDPDPGRDREQLVRLGDARHADVDRQRDPVGAARGEPRRDRARGRSRAASSCSSRTAPSRGAPRAAAGRR
jgi:DNA-binding transcriptional LysR family regulator